MLRRCTLERIGVAPGRLLREPLQDRLQVGVGVGDRDARFDAEVDAVVDVRLELDRQRRVEVGLAPPEARRHDAHDLVVLPDELNRPPHHTRIAGVVPLPELVPEDDDAFGVAALRRIGRDEPSPHQRLVAPVVRRVGRDVRGDDVFRNVAVGGGEVPAVLGDDALERARLPQLLQLGAAQARHPASGLPRPGARSASSARNRRRERD